MKVNLRTLPIIKKIGIMNNNQRLIAEKSYAGDDLSINLIKSGERVLVKQTLASIKAFEKDFDLWFEEHESIVNTEGIV